MKENLALRVLNQWSSFPPLVLLHGLAHYSKDCQSCKLLILENTIAYLRELSVKFVFSKKTTKIDEIFTAYLTLTTWCQLDGEDFVNFCGLLRKRELYLCDFIIYSLFYSMKELLAGDIFNQNRSWKTPLWLSCFWQLHC